MRSITSGSSEASALLTSDRDRPNYRPSWRTSGLEQCRNSFAPRVNGGDAAKLKAYGERLVHIPSTVEPLSYFPLIEFRKLTAIDGKQFSVHSKLFIISEPEQITLLVVLSENSILLMYGCLHYHRFKLAALPLYGTIIQYVGTYIKRLPFVSKAFDKPM